VRESARHTPAQPTAAAAATAGTLAATRSRRLDARQHCRQARIQQAQRERRAVRQALQRGA
jgi:hypothetical protein